MRRRTLALSLLAVAVLGSIVGCCCGSRPCPGSFAQKWSEVQASSLDMSSVGASDLVKLGESRAERDMNLLLLSGGGAHGAWGTGILCGWNARPTFDLVTGVSTGALQATAAFLGQPEDLATLKKFYTTVSNDDIFEDRGKLGLVTGNAMKDPVGLRKLIAEYITPDVVKRVAEAHRNEGRVLSIATVDLDTGRSKPWNLTEIADDPKTPLDARVDRYRTIVLASASAPVIFPPVFIDDHMHVDGGAREQIYVRDELFKLALGWYRARQGKGLNPAKVNVYVIVNGGFGLDAVCVKNCGLEILPRTLGTLLDETLYGNLLRVEKTLKGVFGRDLQVAYSWIPGRTGYDSFDFNKDEMNQLFNRGKSWIENGVWEKAPPMPSDDDLLKQLNALR